MKTKNKTSAMISGIVRRINVDKEGDARIYVLCGNELLNINVEQFLGDIQLGNIIEAEGTISDTILTCGCGAFLADKIRVSSDNAEVPIVNTFTVIGHVKSHALLGNRKAELLVNLGEISDTDVIPIDVSGTYCTPDKVLCGYDVEITGHYTEHGLVADDVRKIRR